MVSVCSRRSSRNFVACSEKTDRVGSSLVRYVGSSLDAS
jgi:hypothetical protein